MDGTKTDQRHTAELRVEHILDPFSALEGLSAMALCLPGWYLVSLYWKIILYFSPELGMEYEWYQFLIRYWIEYLLIEEMFPLPKSFFNGICLFFDWRVFPLTFTCSWEECNWFSFLWSSSSSIAKSNTSICFSLLSQNTVPLLKKYQLSTFWSQLLMIEFLIRIVW